MTDTVISVLITDSQWDDELNPSPQPAVLIATNATHNAYLSHSTADWSAIAHTVVGEWDEQTGAPLIPVGDDYAEWINPFGNVDGKATGAPDSTRWQGHGEKKLYHYEVDETDPENVIITAQDSPDDNQAFSLLIERQFIEDDGFPDIPHGWKVTMVSEDPNRDVTARGIGIYSDPEATQFLYTTGAFVPDGETFSTVCPVGQRTADKVQINFALLLGSAQEGIWNLPIGTDSGERRFWEKDQIPPPAGGEWIDSGHVVESMAGTTTITDDNSSFFPAQIVRIETFEMTVMGLWTSTGLVLEPYRASTVGAAIQIQDGGGGGANVLDLDHDGLPDSIVGQTPQGALITSDADSINIDTNRDGNADIVIPK